MLYLIQNNNFYVKVSLHRKTDYELEINRIIRKVSDISGISENKLKSKSKEGDIVEWRHIICFICRENKYGTFKEIGYKLGDRHHSTIIYGAEKVQHMIDANDIYLMNKLNRVKMLINK